MTPEPAYRALPLRSLGFRLRLFQASERGYLGPDHLLVVETLGYRETYHRYYYRDIQAIQVYAHPEQRYWNSAFGLLGLLLGVWAFYLWADDPWTPLAVVLGLLAGLNALGLGWSLYSGPACRARLRLDGEWKRLTLWSNRRAARAGLALLEPLLALAQAELVPAPADGPLVQGLDTQPPQAAEPLAPPPPGLHSARISLGVAAVLLATTSVYDGLSFAGIHQDELSQIVTLTAWAACAAAMALSVRGGRRAVMTAMLGLATIVVQLLCEFGSAFYSAALDPRHPARPPSMLERVHDPVEGSFIAVWVAVGLIGALLMGWRAWHLERPR